MILTHPIKPMMALLLALWMLWTLTGCESMGPQARTGSVAGGVLGATAGGIIGHQSGRGLEGAAIGAGAGAVTGGLVGQTMDKRRSRDYSTGDLTITDIADMGQDGVPEDVIIDKIKRTRSRYHLTSDVIAYLKRNNVSDRVIDYMMETSG